jgi:hypothetical protein
MAMAQEVSMMTSHMKAYLMVGMKPEMESVMINKNFNSRVKKDSLLRAPNTKVLFHFQSMFNTPWYVFRDSFVNLLITIMEE